ncbi:sulfite exporter TauE/SafE family protein [Microtetraspora malaysiensis]|uniref:sulfite exporter TauE/SafE family protein n=1 Tax=Microtetraspora malaysiensis TaxID=161358 RepID=UPI00082E1346|nr:sulfite exporter TauE/SafE family protein [Microtetraspora malaysiensis]
MSVLVLAGIGLLTGLTTVLFGFGGGFVTVPVIVWADARLGADAAHVAVATSAVVMIVNACVATVATDRAVLSLLRRSKPLLALLAAGGAIGALATRWTPAFVTQWAFVAYLVATIVDVLVRPGFLHRRAESAVTGSGRGEEAGRIRAALGIPIGATASFLGVGGSVMTVPLLRRLGHDMRTATTLANPLTLAVATPALVLFGAENAGSPASAGVFLYGPVDLGAAAALLAGALPVIVVMRRRPPRISDRLHAWSYLALLVLVTATMAVLSLGDA